MDTARGYIIERLSFKVCMHIESLEKIMNRDQAIEMYEKMYSLTSINLVSVLPRMLMAHGKEIDKVNDSKAFFAKFLFTQEECIEEAKYFAIQAIFKFQNPAKKDIPELEQSLLDLGQEVAGLFFDELYAANFCLPRAKAEFDLRFDCLGRPNFCSAQTKYFFDLRSKDYRSFCSNLAWMPQAHSKLKDWDNFIIGETSN